MLTLCMLDFLEGGIWFLMTVEPSASFFIWVKFPVTVVTHAYTSATFESTFIANL